MLTVCTTDAGAGCGAVAEEAEESEEWEGEAMAAQGWAANGLERSLDTSVTDTMKKARAQGDEQ